jgi:hypothetical protein
MCHSDYLFIPNLLQLEIFSKVGTLKVLNSQGELLTLYELDCSAD